MIVDQEMDVGDVGLAAELVEQHPDQHGDIDGQHQAPGIFPYPQIHSAPETKIRAGLSHARCEARNARLFSLSSQRTPGPITPVVYCERRYPPPYLTARSRSMGP